jgi:hypothetical protein
MLSSVSRRPLMHYVQRMGDADSRWEEIGDYAIWTGNRKPDQLPLQLLELHDRSVIPIPWEQSAPILHRIPAGTPYHVRHLFGFWITVDTDTVWLQARYGEPPFGPAVYYSLMLGGARTRPLQASCSWYCPSCGTPLHGVGYAMHPHGLAGFLRAAQEVVCEFNGSRDRRTCRECGDVHPPGYGFYPQDDLAEEGAARWEW